MLITDLRYALRGFARSPAFTTAAVLSLAIGIGANTSVFSVASALLLHPLRYQDADRLVILWNRSPGLNIAEDWFSTAQYFDIKTGHHGFEQVAIAIGGNYNLTGDGGVIDHKDFLDRVDLLGSLGKTVLISNYARYFRLSSYLSRYTKKMIGIAMGVPSLREIFEEKYYTDLEGGILEAVGRLFKNDLRLYVYPAQDPATGSIG